MGKRKRERQQMIKYTSLTNLEGVTKLCIKYATSTHYNKLNNFSRLHHNDIIIMTSS